MISLAFLAALCASHVTAQSFAAIPENNKVYLGMCESDEQIFEICSSYDLTGPDLSAGFLQTPASSNALAGYNFPIFQIGQSIPLPPYDYSTGAGGEALFSSAADTNTNAAYMLTVYPDQNGNLAAVQDSDLVQLANQISVYQSQGRVVYLRFAPEMGGIWNVYGLQPTLFKSLWIRMYTIVKQIAPNTVILWSPNTSYGYPSGATLSGIASAEDRAALDTNGDGQLTALDDAFSPYYPGDQYVDWAGVSLYYKGPGFQNVNEAQPGGFCTNVLAGFDPFYAANYTPFYDTYCSNRPCMLSEAGAAYHVDVPTGASQLQLQQAWWEDCLTNTTFYDLHPNIKAILMFEHAKVEFDGGVADDRDYRVLNATDVRTAFQSALAAMGDRFVWANSTITGSNMVDPALDTKPPTIPSVSASAVMWTVVPSLTETITYTSTGYSTPYLNPSGATLLPQQTGLTISGAVQSAPGVVNAVQTSSASTLSIFSLSTLLLGLASLFAIARRI